jgi:acyl-CoA oxidase
MVNSFSFYNLFIIGTNTKKLETTATYDPKTQEFVLNSPTISSFKWWPGNLGKVASMVVVMADLRINNTSYGMHPFFVRIRDETTHKLLPSK